MKSGVRRTAMGRRVSIRRASFLDVSTLLAIIEGAIEHGCRTHYEPVQRRAVYLSYALNLFVDVVSAHETLVIEEGGVGMARFGFKSYDLQTVPPWFFRSRHAHDEEEIRGAVSGVTTFHFDEGPVTLEAGDILIIPSGVQHEVRSHNGRTFSAYKGSRSGARHVTEHGDGRGSVEDLARGEEQP